jgi:hypothetical protein
MLALLQLDCDPHFHSRPLSPTQHLHHTIALRCSLDLTLIFTLFHCLPRQNSTLTSHNCAALQFDFDPYFLERLFLRPRNMPESLLVIVDGKTLASREAHPVVKMQLARLRAMPGVQIIQAQCVVAAPLLVACITFA